MPILLIPFLCLLFSCEPLVKPSSSGPQVATQIHQLENDVYSGKIPTIYQVTETLNNTLSGPKGDCVEDWQTGWETTIKDTRELYRRYFIKAKGRIKSHAPELLEQKLSDKSLYCPKYDSLNKEDKANFYAHVLTSLANEESDGFTVDMEYDEGKTSRKLAGVTSTGLLQLSVPSVLQPLYQNAGCPVKKGADLKIPEKNLYCGVAMMKALVGRDGCITCKKGKRNKGMSAYWSVMRKPYSIRSGFKTIKLGKSHLIARNIKTQMPNCFQ